MSNLAKIAAIFAILLGVLILLYSRDEYHFEQCLNGFWVHDSDAGKCILYVDTSAQYLRIITVPGSNLQPTQNEKLQISLKPCIGYDLYIRRYKLSGSKSKASSKIGIKLTKPGLQADLYASEGTMIISDAFGDIMTLIKDNAMTMELLV